MSASFLDAVVQRAADCRGEMPASPPPLSLSLLGSDAHGEIAAACAVLSLHRMRRVSRSWHLVANPELSRRLELLPSELRMTHAERAALVAKYAKDVVEDAREAWQVLDEQLVSLTELESMMNDIGIQVPPGTIRQAAVWQRLQLPGNPAKRAFARACHLEAFTFEDLCLVVEMSLLDYDGPVCGLCNSVWSKVPGWRDFECRSHGLCFHFATGAGLSRGEEVISARTARAGVAAVYTALGMSGAEDARCQKCVATLSLGSGPMEDREMVMANIIQDELEAYFDLEVSSTSWMNLPLVTDA